VKYLKLVAVLLALLGVPALPVLLGAIPSTGMRRSRSRFPVKPDQ
jgi:hypothetical protein